MLSAVGSTILGLLSLAGLLVLFWLGAPVPAVLLGSAYLLLPAAFALMGLLVVLAVVERRRS